MRLRAWSSAALLLILALAYPAISAPNADQKKYTIGDTVADFVLKDENGKTVKLSQYKGKVIVLNFYASW